MLERRRRQLTQLIEWLDAGDFIRGNELQAAQAAQPAWAGLTGVQRAAYLQRTVEPIQEHQEELAQLITREQGAQVVMGGARPKGEPFRKG